MTKIDRTNFSEDIESGKKVSEDFLKKLSIKNYDDAFMLIDTLSINKKDFINFYEKVFEKTGNIKSFEFEKAESEIAITNGIYSGGMNVYYKIQNDSLKSEIKIVLEFKLGNKLIITGYTPSIDLFNN